MTTSPVAGVAYHQQSLVHLHRFRFHVAVNFFRVFHYTLEFALNETKMAYFYSGFFYILFPLSLSLLSFAHAPA